MDKDVPIMLTIKETAEKCKASNIRLTAYYIRRLALEGKIPALRIGKLTLVNWDGLVAYLKEQTSNTPVASEATAAPTASQNMHRIQPIAERLHAQGW